MTYPWEDPAAPEHVRTRRPIMELSGPFGIRRDLPKRRPADRLPESLRNLDYGIVIMSHRGSSNGRLSVLLSSIPENYPVVVSSDSIHENDVAVDKEVCEHHGARFAHCTPWGGRARNAIHCMAVTTWKLTLYLCDDVWLFPETCRQALQWCHTYQSHGIPLASLAIPGYDAYHQYAQLGMESWEQCLREPWRLNSALPVHAYELCPKLYKNPFGACFVIVREAYEKLGGFSEWYWAHDDVWSHLVWTSLEWVSAGYPGRGYAHLGAQSWHHGETLPYIGSFERATGISPEESGRRQDEAIKLWQVRLRDTFLSLGGEP